MFKANGCQTAFSNLRLCCPLALGPLVKRRLTISGQKVVERVTQLHRAEAASFSGKTHISQTFQIFLGHIFTHLYLSVLFLTILKFEGS
jgi:hypothetical protein